MNNYSFLPGDVSTECSVLRIPGMLVGSSKSVFVFCEARSAGSDWANINLMLFVSRNGAAGFLPPVIMANGFDDKKTYNNPVMVQDKNGALHFLYCANYGVSELNGGVYERISTDDGATWSEPEDISYILENAGCNAFALGPGHGVCLNDGTLVIACWLVKKGRSSELTSHHPGSVCALISKDNGNSWFLSACFEGEKDLDPNETAVAAFSDGSLLFNIRCGTKPERLLVFGTDYAKHFSAIQECRLLEDPVCFGSMTQFGDEILFANCCDTSRRINLTVKRSNNGINWRHFYTVTPFEAGYSDIAVLNNKILTVYECEKKLMLHIFNTDSLTEE